MSRELKAESGDRQVPEWRRLRGRTSSFRFPLSAFFSTRAAIGQRSAPLPIGGEQDVDDRGDVCFGQ